MVSDQGNQLAANWTSAWWRTAMMGLIIAGAAVVAYLAFEHYLRVAATVLLFAGMLTYILQPMVNWVMRFGKAKREHAARTVAVALVYVLMGLLVYGFGAVLARTISNEKHALQTTWESARLHIPQQVINWQHWYEQTVPQEIREQVNFDLQREINQFPTKYWPVVAHWLLGFTQKAGKALGLLIELLLVPIIAFYFLTDSAKVREQVLYFVPRRHRASVERYAGGVDQILRQYIKGQLLLCAIAWIVVTVALLLMHIPGALLLGLVAGVARGIPVMGPVVGGIPVLGAVLLNPHMSGAFWWVLIGFVALHLFESKYLMPRILGESLGVHPVLIIVSLLVGYEVLGLLGMFLAPPAVAMVRFMLAINRNEPTVDSAQANQPGVEALVEGKA